MCRGETGGHLQGRQRVVYSPHCTGDTHLTTCRSPMFGLDSRYRKTVVGVVSFGPARCGSGLPGVFTKVESFLPWIRERMRI